MIDVLHREAVYLWYYFSVQLEQILKYWVLGMVLGSLVSVFLKERIHGVFRSMGRSGWKFSVLPPPAPWGLLPPFVCMGPSPLPHLFPKVASGMSGWQLL